MNTRSTGHREQQVLEFIRAFRLERGYPPTIREIAKGIGLNSHGSVHDMIKSLHRRRAILWRPNQRRSIELIPVSPVLTVELPAHLYANVQAVARQAKVTPEAVVIEAVRDGFSALRSVRGGVSRSGKVLSSDSRETFTGEVGLAKPELRNRALGEPAAGRGN